MATSTKAILGTALLGLLASPTAARAAAGIEVKAAQVYPEGVAYNEKSGEFLVSSMRKGTIGALKADGKYREFARDPLLISAVGLHTDAARGRLFACVADPGVALKTGPKTYRKVSRLLVFDLKSGKRLKAIDLQSLAPGEHFCNDIAVAGAGNAYVTDSLGPFIYKVDPTYKASLFLRSDLFQGANGFNLNGIVHHEGGFLIVAKSSDGSLWRVPEDTPGVGVHEIALSEKLPNADGLIMTASGDLLVIQNAEHRVSRVKSTDGWRSAKVDKTLTLEAAFPTTGVEAGGKIYVLLAHLNELFENPKTAKSDSFTLTEVSFP